MCINSTGTQWDLIPLADDLHNAALSMKNREYSNYMFLEINKLLTFDSAWLSVISFSEMKVSFEVNFLFNQSDKMIGDYKKRILGQTLGHEPLQMQEQIKQYPRRAIDFETIQSYDEYIDSKLFSDYGRSYEIHQAMTIATPFSKFTNKGLILNIYSADPDRRFEKEELSLFESIFSFIIFPLWCGKLGVYNNTSLESNESVNKNIATKFRFTQREKDVINEILQGNGFSSNKELAKRLKISPRTVNIHLGSIYEKTGMVGGNEMGVNKKIKLLKLLKSENYG